MNDPDWVQNIDLADLYAPCWGCRYIFAVSHSYHLAEQGYMLNNGNLAVYRYFFVNTSLDNFGLTDVFSFKMQESHKIM